MAATHHVGSLALLPQPADKAAALYLAQTRASVHAEPSVRRKLTERFRLLDASPPKALSRLDIPRGHHFGSFIVRKDLTGNELISLVNSHHSKTVTLFIGRPLQLPA